MLVRYNVDCIDGKLRKIKYLIENGIHISCKSAIQVRSDKKVYKVLLADGNYVCLYIRGFGKSIAFQQLAFDNQIKVPKILFSYPTYKITEWIHGDIAMNHWKKLKVFSKAGEFFGKMNSVKQDNLCLTTGDFSSTNIIWTLEEELYLVDCEKLRLVDNPLSSIIGFLLKRVKVREKIDVFLDSYSKYLPIDKIVENCESRDWKWK